MAQPIASFSIEYIATAIAGALIRSIFRRAPWHITLFYIIIAGLFAYLMTDCIEKYVEADLIGPVFFVLGTLSNDIYRLLNFVNADTIADTIDKKFGIKIQPYSKRKKEEKSS